MYLQIMLLTEIISKITQWHQKVCRQVFVSRFVNWNKNDFQDLIMISDLMPSSCGSSAKHSASPNPDCEPNYWELTDVPRLYVQVIFQFILVSVLSLRGVTYKLQGKFSGHSYHFSSTLIDLNETQKSCILQKGFGKYIFYMSDGRSPSDQEYIKSIESVRVNFLSKVAGTEHINPFWEKSNPGRRRKKEREKKRR